MSVTLRQAGTYLFGLMQQCARRGNRDTIRNREQVQAAAAHLHASHRTEIIALRSRCCKSQDEHPGLIIKTSEHLH